MTIVFTYHPNSTSPCIVLEAYFVSRKAEMHENRQFFSTGMEFAKNAYAIVLKALSRS